VLELREVLRAEYRKLPTDQIERIFESTLGVSPEDLEDVENFWRAVSNALPQVLPLAGTALGTLVGGPILGPVGGVLGSAAGRAIGGALGQPPSPPSMQQPTPPMQQPPRMAPPTPTPMPGGSPAAAQLLQTMLDPRTMQALMAMLMGQAGRQKIPVGNTQVETSAFTNLLGVLADQASAESNAVVTPAYGESPRYWQNFAGEPMGDPAVPEHRAAELWELLQETDPGERRSYAGWRESQAYQEDDRELDDQFYYEMIELAELDTG
jgi:hypothetical protein